MSRSARFEQEVARLKGKRIAAVGLGISNMSVISFLRSVGCSVVALDRSSASELGPRVAQLRDMGVTYRLGDSYLDDLDQFDEIFISPGVPPHTPQIQAAASSGAEINGEIKLFLRLCGSRIIGITGSAGKTTTASLVSAIISGSGRKAVLAGNIGAEILSKLDSIDDDATVVLELSSFQLQIVDSSPPVGAILNLAPNHLDQHTSIEEYYSSKQNIIRFQSPEDYAVLNNDDPNTSTLAGTMGGRPLLYGLHPMEADGMFRIGEGLVYQTGGTQELICRTSDVRLLGEHNLSNAIAAALMCRICGIDAEAICNTVRSFTGVVHRLEPFLQWRGVSFFNDSIATSPDRTIAAIRAVGSPVVLIAGGYDKNLNYDELGRVIASEVRALVLVGAASDKIHRSVEKAIDRRAADRQTATLAHLHRASTFEEAVEVAVSLAEPGDTVLLSPACASFDLFKSYKDRGDMFKRLVAKLTAEQS